MRKLLLKRPTFALLVIALWISFASIPTAETRQLSLKVAGEIIGIADGDPVKIKVKNSTLKQNPEIVDEDPKLVLEVGDVTIITTNIVTNVTAVATASFSNTVTNVSLTATSSTTNPVTSVSPSLAVCNDGSVTNLLTVTTSLLTNGAAFGSSVFTNGQTSLQVSETNGNVDTIVTFSTNLTTTCIEGGLTENITFTIALTNIVTTNTTTTIITDAISILLVDPQGNLLSTLFEFDSVIGVTNSAGFQKFFAVGAGVDSVFDPAIFGDVSFGDAVLAGRLEFNSNALPRSFSATIQANGESDEGTVLFKGKFTGDNPFNPAPTNFNATANPP